MGFSREERIQELTVRWTHAQPTVSAFILSMVPDTHDAEDLLQNVALAALAKIDTYDASRPFISWALGIARIEVLRYRSAHASNPRMFDQETIDQVAAAYEDVAPEMDEMKQALVNCTRKLHGRGRQLIELHYVRGLKPARIAQQLGTTTNAIFAALHRVRRALQQCIEARVDHLQRGRA